MRTNRLGTHATAIHPIPNGFAIAYHATDIVSVQDIVNAQGIASGKVIRLDNGGYHTATTKARMNQAARQFGLPYSVYQEHFQWYIEYNNRAFPFDKTAEIRIENGKDSIILDA
jgi:hypothetical protein